MRVDTFFCIGIKEINRRHYRNHSSLFSFSVGFHFENLSAYWSRVVQGIKGWGFDNFSFYACFHIYMKIVIFLSYNFLLGCSQRDWGYCLSKQSGPFCPLGHLIARPPPGTWFASLQVFYSSYGPDTLYESKLKKKVTSGCTVYILGQLWVPDKNWDLLLTEGAEKEKPYLHTS